MVPGVILASGDSAAKFVETPIAKPQQYAAVQNVVDHHNRDRGDLQLCSIMAIGVWDEVGESLVPHASDLRCPTSQAGSIRYV